MSERPVDREFKSHRPHILCFLWFKDIPMSVHGDTLLEAILRGGGVIPVMR